MSHIARWPRELNWPFGEPMFAEGQDEKSFWAHLMSCSDCKLKFLERFDDEGPKDERFWMQVQEYLHGVHPGLIRIAKVIKLAAKHDLMDDPSKEIGEEVWEKSRELDYHLMICSRCSQRYFGLYSRLLEHDSDVRDAYHKWSGLYTKSE